MRAVRWMFRSRSTGRITIVQWPNVSLWIVLGVWVARALLDPTGVPRTVLDAVGTVAVLWWGGDEAIRGVNPWRRALGAAAVAVTIAGMAS